MGDVAQVPTHCGCGTDWAGAGAGDGAGAAGGRGDLQDAVDDEAGRDGQVEADERAVGDEGFRSAENILVAVGERAGADALQIRASAGLCHGDRAYDFAACQAGEESLFLRYGAVV